MAEAPTQTILRDPQLFCQTDENNSYWILIPITIVMILTGVLRHYATILTASTPKKQDLPSIREQQSLLRGINLRNNGDSISPESFTARQNFLVGAFKNGAFLKEPDKKGQGAPNPMTDPAAMEGMMGMMKGNIAMIVPQTLIMGWINTFFSGFVIIRLPFPLTIKFKSMLQAGVATREMDPQWMSSISWYVLCIFGLQPVINYVAGSDDAAGQMSQQLGQMNPAASAQIFGPGVDSDKQFQNEAENIAVLIHHYVLEGVEDRLLNYLRT
ncbi:ER membrane protein complex subunit 3 [Golovinomyces cichoracearum]|uniref:ER membrane protein complex subunit 3 n=1 Tax=Golovinomyces cichoracearum TaxID=62708 RepID=A0A420I8U5_9PEZI|nr:ER membrane protein complex subunit 3 [Golovinomyces cichoracearum]